MAVTILKKLILIILGIGGGTVISGAVFAFITIIGVVPRLAEKTKTTSHIVFYENAIIAGGIFLSKLYPAHIIDVTPESYILFRSSSLSSSNFISL